MGFVYRNRTRLLVLMLLSGVLIVGSITTVNAVVNSASKDSIYTLESFKRGPDVALVLGAQVNPDQTPSDMLRDRLLTAARLYRSGRVKKILVSGDHGKAEYDEVNVMRNYLLERGVKASDLFTDHAGFDTYDSLYRAKAVFGLDSTVVVTQRFHLPRAIYTAKKLGFKNVVGVSADLSDYGSHTKSSTRREIPAKLKAFKDVLLEAEPRFLGPKISIDGDGRESWDRDRSAVSR